MVSDRVASAEDRDSRESPGHEGLLSKPARSDSQLSLRNEMRKAFGC
jgi:hypothetical protein